AADPARLGAARLALVGTHRSARGMDGLGLRRPLSPGVRPADLRRSARARLLRDTGRKSDRRLRAADLPRHVRLTLRQRLEAGELVPRAQSDGTLLLQLPGAGSDEGVSAPGPLS